MRIGLDLDNTLVCYDAVFAAQAAELGLLPSGAAEFQDRLALRAAVRALPDGERRWQQLQGRVYGRGMAAASPFPGLMAVLATARQRGDDLMIVSHRTLRPHFDPDGPGLHDAARDWLRVQGWTSGPEALLSPDKIFLEISRAAKLARIAALSPDVFIDDLPDVLNDPAFPSAVRPVLFSPVEGWSRLAEKIWR